MYKRVNMEIIAGSQEIDGYFEGEKSLDKTVDELFSRISIKQSEEE